MAKQTVNLGQAPSGAGGDVQRVANIKFQGNFDELYARLQSATSLDIAGSGVVTLSAAQALSGILILSGALTGNREVAVPEVPAQSWLVLNRTTGAYTVRVRTTGGSGPLIDQGGGATVLSDGVSIYDVDAVMRQQAGLLSAFADAEIGRVSFFATATVPTGYLECTGAAVLRADFPKLFGKIGTVFGAGNGTTTFNIPDLRGEFLRGWDHGRGVDAGRTFGSFEADLLKTHYHNLRITQDSSGQVVRSSAGGTTQGNASIVRMQGDDVSSVFQLYAAADGSNMGAETRPRNVALMPCIKY